MKIVHVMNWYIPGMGYQENILPAEQKNLGHEVYIITSDRVPNYDGYEKNVGKIIGGRIIGVGTFQEKGVTIYRLPTILEIQNGGQVLVKNLYKILRMLKPDIVQAHGAFCPITLQAILYSKKLKYKVFVDDHSNKDNFLLDSSIKKIYIKLVKAFYGIYAHRITMFLPVTYPTRDLLKRVLQIPDKKLILLPLGANVDYFKKSQKLRDVCRKQLGIKENEKLILTAGKLNERKDIEILIKAIKYVSEKSPLIKLLIIGNGTKEYMYKLKNLIQRLGIINKVIFIDFVSNKELPKYYNAGDIGVWPGDCSITVIEAAATQLPLILPEHDLAYKILFDNYAALGFERGNVKSLVDAIFELLGNRFYLLNKLQPSKIIFDATLSWKQIARKSIEIYS